MLKKQLPVMAAMVAAALILAACGTAGVPAGNPASQPASLAAAVPADITFTDALGNTVQVPANPQKTVALQGSYAQLWLEAGGTLAGVTNDFATNYQDELPQDAVIVGSLKEPSLETLLELRPDFVILSPDITAQAKLHEPLKQAGIAHGYFKQETYTDYLDMLKLFTDMTGQKTIYTEMEQTITRQVAEVTGRASRQNRIPKVLLVRGMSSGVHVLDSEHSAGQILQQLHAENLADKYPSLLKEMSLEVILDENPDYILVVPMGDVKAANTSFWDMVAANPLWQQVGAIKNNQVHLLPKELFQLKPNACWGESYEYLADILYPNQ